MVEVTIRKELDVVYKEYLKAIQTEDFEKLQSVSVGVIPPSIPETLQSEAFCYLRKLFPRHTDMKFVSVGNDEEDRADYYHTSADEKRALPVNAIPFRKVCGEWKVAGISTPRPAE